MVEGAAAALGGCGFRQRARRSQDFAEARSGGAARLHLLGGVADLALHRLGVLVAGLELFGDLGRDAALLRVQLDVFHHLDFSLREAADQLAGFVGRRTALACGLDEIAAPLGFLPQRQKALHAFFPARRAGLLRHRRSAARNRGSTLRRECAGRAETRGRSRAVHGWKRRRGACRRSGARRWAERALRQRGSGMADHGGRDKGRGETAHLQITSPGHARPAERIHRAAAISGPLGSFAFYDSRRTLTTC